MLGKPNPMVLSCRLSKQSTELGLYMACIHTWKLLKGKRQWSERILGLHDQLQLSLKLCKNVQREMFSYIGSGKIA